jgi:nicotinamidase/pyrazinamidase
MPAECNSAIPGGRALLIIDIQNDFLPGGALAVPEGDRIVSIANTLMPRYETIVASQDWHPPRHGSFATAANLPVYSQFELGDLPQTAWPDHCVQGTRGAELAPELESVRITHIVCKGLDPAVDSYSAFFDNARRNDTGLHAWLQRHGVNALDVCGLATDYCVKFTVLDALNLGYRVRVIADACRGVNLKPGDCDQAIAEMRTAGAEMTNRTDLLNGTDDVMTLFRPVGPKELELIHENGWTAYPPRLPEQPIFYPVLNEEYADEIAREWNLKESGAGFVTRFKLPRQVVDRYPSRIVGGKRHAELWIPSEHLESVNQHIIGNIELVRTYRKEIP